MTGVPLAPSSSSLLYNCGQLQRPLHGLQLSYIRSRLAGLRTSPVRRSSNHARIHTLGGLSHGKVLSHSHSFGAHSQKSLSVHTFLSADSQLLAGHSHTYSQLRATYLGRHPMPSTSNVHQNRVVIIVMMLY
jgi:hypothetical protein